MVYLNMITAIQSGEYGGNYPLHSGSRKFDTHSFSNQEGRASYKIRWKNWNSPNLENGSQNWVVHILAIIYAKYRLHRKVQLLPNESGHPGVTILKPLMGVDPNLFSNLETFFTMNYPLYEIHFCIEDESDPAIMVAKRLQGWFFREACSPYQFLKALFNPTIKWRSRTYKLKWGGVAEECKV
ncbi:hypothetical protein GE061_017566 [Apolygus lucorum]|uniref:Uncharacterized protein n=1 Tax=Apolygus lucorum TaxID=248454 RepID=A0A8S9XCR8_APOLU|nr:hypothetical protein GE061_017566 [Apolygus lucorum]